MALNVGTLVVEVRGDDKQFQQTMDRTESRVGRASGVLGRGAKVLGGAALGGLTALGGLGISTASKMETAEIAFSTMLGSGTKARSFLGDLSSFAAKTPFELPELQTAAQSLVSIGINAGDVIPIMTSLGNITSGMGTGSEGVKRATIAIQQMNAAGRITAEDLNQLRDAGIPVYELLAKATGKSVTEVANLAQKGKLGRKELGQLMTALKSGKGLERFNGMMTKQSQSLSGLWSTLKDTVSVGLADAVKPLIPVLKTGLAGAISLVSAKMPLLKSGLASFVAYLPRISAGAKGLYDLIVGGDYTGALYRAFGWEEDSGAVDKILGIRDAVVQLFAGLKGTDGQQVGAGLSGFFSSLAGMGPILNSVLGSTSWVFQQLGNHAGLVAKAMPFLLTGFAAYKTLQIANNALGRNSVIGFYMQVGSTIALTFANRALASSQQQLLASTAAVNTAERAGIVTRARSALVTAGKTIAEKASSAASKGMAAAQWLLNASVGAFPLLWIIGGLLLVGAGLVLLWKKSETFRNIVMGAWNGIKNAAGAVKDWFVSTAWPAMQNVFSWIGQKALWLWRNVLQPAWNGIKAGAGAMFGFFRDSVWPVMRTVFGWLGTAVRVWWSGMKTYVGFVVAIARGLFGFFRDSVWPVMRTVFGWLGTAVSRWWGGVKLYFGYISTAARTLYGFFRNTVAPVIRTAFSSIGSGIKWVWDNVISKAFNGIKTGVDLVKKAFDGAKTGIKRAWDSLKGIVAKPVNAVITAVINPLIRGVDALIPGDQKSWLLNPIKAAGGSWVPGHSPTPTADNIPAWLTAKEFVVRQRSALSIARQHPGALEYMNRTGQMPQVAAHAGGGWAGKVVALGRALASSGYRVGEHPSFGGVHPVHRQGSDHYKGLALDVNWNHGNEKLMLSRAVERFMKGFGVIWQRPGHFGHVHVGPPGSMSGETYLGGGRYKWGAGGGGDMTGVASAGGGFDPFQALKDKVAGYWSSVTAKFKGNQWLGMPVNLGKQAITGLWDKATSLLPSLGIGSDLVDVVKGITGAVGGPIKAQVKKAAAPYGWDQGPQWNAIDWLVGKESSWNPTAQNPSSTAYGLFQFLNSTWRTYNRPKTSNPFLQAVAGMLHIKTRYKTPIGATQFWRANHWYANGGHVREHDNGGWLEPGELAINNGMRRERTLSESESGELMRTLRALNTQIATAAMSGGGRASVHVEARTDASPGDIADELLWALRRSSTGGRYANV